MLKFADDTKCLEKIKSDADRQELQDDLNKLTEWSKKFQMLFNFGKCKCLHTGHGNEGAPYTMGHIVLNTTVTENDLRLAISSDLGLPPKWKYIHMLSIMQTAMHRKFLKGIF